ncbi:MAG: hypothetical protein JSR96_06535 [Proteobacteria bacterium]|nr:hypothetical protein [Pseudomonadota bacterium]
MSDFEKIRKIILHYENLAREEYGGDFVSIANKNFSDLQLKYYSKEDNPDYSPNIKKFCYLYKYVVPHGYFIYSTFKRLRREIKPAIFSRNPTRIACIGGGPGTEILGLCRYLRECEADYAGHKIELIVFDRELSWRESCDMILDSVGNDLNIVLKFVQFDATISASYEAIDFSKFHFVTSNFFMSEIRKAKIVGATGKFWKFLFKSMGSGKVFVAIDFADADGSGWAHLKGILPKNHVSVIADPALTMSCPDSKTCILELKAELDHRPKKNAQNYVMAVIT